MKISEYAIKNNAFTLIMVLMAAALGISTLLNMPRSEDPETHAPFFSVVVIYPGENPKDMEEYVVKPMEKEIYALEDIKRIKTNIQDGLAVINVEYQYNVNVDNKYQELVREVNAIKSRLPSDIYSIETKKFIPSDVNILQLALVSENASRNTINTVAQHLQDELEKIPELKNVEIQGLSDRTIRVDVQLEKLAQMKIPVNIVADALQSEVANIPGGNVSEGTKTFNIKTNNTFQNIDEIKNVVVVSREQGTVLLKDIANVYFDYAPDTHITRLNGYRCAFVVAALKERKNISETQKKYADVINRFKKTLPSNIDLQLAFDQAQNVNGRLSRLGEDFMIAIALVLLTLLPLGTRASLVVMIAIPLSLGIGIISLNAFGYNLNQLSIVGLVVALGLLVDDSIVVVENIERWMREGHSRMEATLKATNQISKAVIGCTVTLIIAFMPIAMMPGGAGDFIRGLPLAVMFTIIGSMAVALTVVPFLSSKILKPSKDEHGNFFLRMLQKAIHGSYSKLLDKALKYPVITLCIAGIIFIGSLFLFPVVGSSLFPASEKPQFLVNITTPLQSNISYSDSIARDIEKELKKIPEVKYIATNVGKGNPRIYYNVNQKNEQSNIAELFVQLFPDVKPKVKEAIIEQLRKKWTPYLNAKVNVVNFEQGEPVTAPVEVRLEGDNLDSLRHLAAVTENLLLKTKGTMYVDNPVKNLKSDIRIYVNKEKAQNLGVSTINISRTVRMALAGLPVGTYSNPNSKDEDYTIVVSTPHAVYPDLNVLNNIYVNANDGRAIPLSQLATIGFETSPQTIDHFNKIRAVSIFAHVQQGFLASNVINDVTQQMSKIALPQGYRFVMAGEQQNKDDSFEGFGTVILVTLFMFVAVLVLQFKTFKSTLIVLSVIPLGIVGAVLALLVTGNSLSFVATIGIITLAGIEVKNTILLVDFTNQLREQGMELNQAIEEAGEKRFLPIILTTLTAIGGLLPIAFSDNPLISPLAIVMIGGLITSTVLSRIVTPVVYKLIPPKIETRSKDL
ncbi:MAG: efflux RND transporter permease subunit [Arachidicoccus sp.]|nr:efflux RND transporter permease subunit [Arachidicoccus sp.]